MLELLFTHYFRKEARALAISAIALGLVAVFVCALSHILNLQQTLGVFREAFKAMPVLLAAIGGDLSLLDPAVVLVSAIFTLVAPLFLTVHTTELALGIYTREASNGTLEFLFSLPVDRFRLVISRILVLLTSIAVLSGALTLGLHAGLSLISGSVHLPALAVLGLNLFALFACLSGLSFLTSLAFTDPTRATLVMLGVGFGLFSLHAVLNDNASWLDWANPYHYLALNNVLHGQAFPWRELGVLGLGAAILWAGAIILFVRKQI